MPGQSPRELLVTRDDAIRKWGTQLLYLLAPDAPAPDQLFDPVDHRPVLPEGAKQVGFITTDGTSQEDSISNESTSMLQSLEPVRYDLTGIERSFSFTAGEDNAIVQGIWHGVPFEDLADDAYGAWDFSDGEVSDYPWYRLGCIMQDGVGSLARYRHEFGYRVTLTAKESRTANRTDPETYGFTFGLTKDPVYGRSFRRAQDSPSYHTTGDGGGSGE